MKYVEQNWHCDEYIDDESKPEVLRNYLRRARAPAHGHLENEPYPLLFADHKGIRVRIVMASRMGDVGITPKLDEEYGYRNRVTLDELTNFSDKP